MRPSSRATSRLVASPSTISASSSAVGAGAERESCGNSPAMASTSSGVTSRTISIAGSGTSDDGSAGAAGAATIDRTVVGCRRCPPLPSSGPLVASRRRSNPSPPRSTSRPSATPPTPSSASDRAPARPTAWPCRTARPTSPAGARSWGRSIGPVVAAAFAVFNPAVVVPAVAHGWTLTDATTIAAARDEGAIAQLCRILGDEPAGLHRAVQLLLRAVEPLHPAGKPLFSGLTSLAMPEPPLGVAWRLDRSAARVPGRRARRGVDRRRLRRPRDRAADRALLGSAAPLLPADPGLVDGRPGRARSSGCCLGASSPTTVPP